MIIADNVKKIRSEKGYSLEKVARLANVSLNTVVKIENGANQNPTIETLSGIAQVLGVSVDDLLKK